MTTGRTNHTAFAAAPSVCLRCRDRGWLYNDKGFPVMCRCVSQKPRAQTLPKPPRKR